MIGPKTLHERLAWMAANLPGFQDELNSVAQAAARDRSSHGVQLQGTRSQLVSASSRPLARLPTPTVIRCGGRLRRLVSDF